MYIHEGRGRDILTALVIVYKMLADRITFVQYRYALFLHCFVFSSSIVILLLAIFSAGSLLINFSHGRRGVRASACNERPNLTLEV